MSWILAGVLVVVSAALLWWVPLVGFMLTVIALLTLAPWGRGFAERASITAIVMLGVIAVVFPRASTMPITHTSGRILLVGMLVSWLVIHAVLGLVGTRTGRASLRTPLFPRFGVLDLIVIAATAIAAIIPVTAFRGRDPVAVVSSLFHTGWDNVAHFTTFANTMTAQQTLWTTIDGSTAWNQWYPSLHTTAFALAQQAITDTIPARVGLVEPFALWMALAFAVGVGALVWVAGDLGRRLSTLTPYSAAAVSRIAAVAMAFVVILGSPQFLLAAGFVNFFMACVVVIVTSYAVGRSLHAARTLGWFLLPLAALAVIGLWTPLAIGMIPVGVVTAIALWRESRVVALAWVVASAALGGWVGWTQLGDVLAASGSEDAGAFTAEVGEVGVGMTPFNLVGAIAAPVIAIILLVLLTRTGRGSLAWAVAGPVLGAGVLAAVFSWGADTAGVSRITSYYVLKSLDAGWIALLPLVSAVAALAVVAFMQLFTTSARILAATVAALLGVSALGYVGTNADQLADGFDMAPGVYTAWDRHRWLQDDLVGEAIVNAAETATIANEPTFTTLLWDGAGQLPNLWVAALTGVLSSERSTFYRNLPAFPYDEKTLGYLDLTMNVDPELSIIGLWFRPSSGDLLEKWALGYGPERVRTEQVIVPPSALCPEC